MELLEIDGVKYNSFLTISDPEEEQNRGIIAGVVVGVTVIALIMILVFAYYKWHHMPSISPLAPETDPTEPQYLLDQPKPGRQEFAKASAVGTGHYDRGILATGAFNTRSLIQPFANEYRTPLATRIGPMPDSDRA